MRMENSDEQFPDAYEMCCGRGKCPSVLLEKTADPVLVHVQTTELEWFGGADVDGKSTRAGIRLSREQAIELRKWLVQKGF